MNVDEPRVTVAMAAYNERAHLRAAVESVLAQSFGDFELFIVDDGSTDDCLETIADLDDPRIRVHRQANQGKAVALNHILDHGRGEFICLHDGDDLAPPSRLGTQVAALDADPELAAVFCRHELLLDGRVMAPRFRGLDRDESAAQIERFGNPGMDPTIMFRRERTAHIRYEPALEIGQGEDHLLRIGEEFPVAVVDGCHYTYRIHSGSRSQAAGDRGIRFREQVVRRACERRGLVFDPAMVPPRRPRRTAGVTGHVIASTVELTALGRRRQAISTAVRHLRGIWRYPESWTPLIYSFLPGPVLARRRADYVEMVADRARFSK